MTPISLTEINPSFLAKKSWSLNVGTILGIPILVHFSCIFLPILSFLKSWAIGTSPVYSLGALAILLVILFLHELGNCLVAKFFHYHVLMMFFFFGGGLACILPPHSGRNPRADLLIALGGPAVNVIFLTFGFLVFGLPEIVAIHDIIIRGGAFSWTQWIGMAMLLNLFLLLFNLLPIYPMDGGRILTHTMELLCGEVIGKWTGLVVTTICLCFTLVFSISVGFIDGIFLSLIIGTLAYAEFTPLFQKLSK